MRISVLVLTAAAVVGIAAGCQNSRVARIQEQAALFASLDPATQALIQQGLFDRGFTPDLVYLSLGKPSRTSHADTTDGAVDTWVYRNFVYGSSGAMTLSANTPGSKPYGPIVSPNAPGGPSIFSTKPGPVQPTIGDGTDAPVGTLVLEFLNGRLVNARLDL